MRLVVPQILVATAVYAITVAPTPAQLAGGADDQAPRDRGHQDQASKEARFEELMSGCKMVGKFTTTGSKKQPQTDSYTISKVSKVKGNQWRFHAKIEYAGKAVTVPVLVDVLWAGDTPVIQVTKAVVPMMGTYSARVAIYGDQYAGLWSADDHGGHMWGEIIQDKDKASATASSQDKAANWGNWRGPNNNAVGTGKPPLEWDESDGKNIKWKVAVPGKGSSSPIVWGDRVFVTTAVDTGKQGNAGAAAPQRGGGGFGGFGGSRPSTVHDFMVLAYNRKDGSEAWKKTVKSTVPHEGTHNTGTFASPSVSTDGERLYAFFGSRGLYCMDLDGNVKWEKQFGQMRIAMSFGEGSSPALYGDTLIVNWDHQGDSFIVALDKKTGDEIWRKPRQQGTTWATPLVVPVDGRAQVIVPGTRSSRSYDLKTGDEIWYCSGLTSNPIPTPLYENGIVYLMSGYRGNALQAVKLAGAKGNVNDSDNLVWRYNRNTPYTPSGLVYKGYLYTLRENTGVLSCFDAKTGKPYYEGKKMRRISTTYSSIVGANDHIYITSRRGWTKVVKVGPKYLDVASNRVNDTVDATAAIVGNQIFLRGWENLYCIAEQQVDK